MKTLKFPDNPVSTKDNIGSRSIYNNFKTPVDEIFATQKNYDDRIRPEQITNSLKFRIALVAAYSSLIGIFAVVVYTAIVLDPKFPF